MRPVRVRIQGFRRLADTGCDITPRILAFVGQNEAGKSSLLDALAWTTEDGSTALAREDQSRGNRKTSGWICHVIYRVEQSDLDSLDGLDLIDMPARFSLSKLAGGSLVPSIQDKLRRVREPFDLARELLSSALLTPSHYWDSDDEDDAELREWATASVQCLEDPDRDWDGDETSHLLSLRDWFESPPDREETGEEEEKQSPPRDQSLAQALTTVIDLVKLGHPRLRAVALLRQRVPKFVEFEEAFRALPTHTGFDGNGRLSGTAPSIANLLRISAIDVAALEQARRDDDVGEIETITDRGNRRLRQFFSQAWNQSGVGVRFKVKESTLECLIHETEHDNFTNLEERSDGLRAFIALAAFIEAQDLGIPPVLLIDEAETHLHMDAQADLVSVLLGQLNVTQVLYTTHSPGCLPSDLGTGIRLVARDPGSPNTSSLRSDFWTNTGAGFSPLLYAMGASAAAFSVCRYAVLAEGSSEMILLPTLLRQATGLDDLRYQVVQGLAQATIGEDRLDEVAAKVMYLVDGDRDGETYRKKLVKSGVDSGRIKRLPAGWALEDLFEASYVIGKMADLRAMPTVPGLGDLPGTGPIMARLQVWADAQVPRMALAGKTALAYAVVEDPKRKVKPEGTEFLAALHRELLEGFSLIL